MDTEILIAFDVGLKRTGVAIGQTSTRTSQPAGQLLVKNGRFDWPQLDKLLARWQPARVVIGVPARLDPHLGKVINRLKSYIQQQHKLPIVEVDETLTSVAANAELENSGMSLARKTRLRDQLAACLMLDSYMSGLA